MAIEKNIKKQYSTHASSLKGTDGDGSYVPPPTPKNEDEKLLIETIAISVKGLQNKFDSNALAGCSGMSAAQLTPMDQSQNIEVDMIETDWNEPHAHVKVVERANTALPGSPQTQSIAKITIESINSKVPHLTPNDDIKLQLLTRIKADESMMIPFRRWELHELPALTQGSTIEIWSVKTCSALDIPRYVIVFFQTKKADNLHEDVTLFDNANIKSIRLALNSDYYPQERMLLDFSRDQYADAHFNYTEFNKSYHNCQEKRSLVNFAEFKSRPMFVIDCSRRYLGLKSSTVDITLEIEATTGFPPDTKAYCIIIHDQIMEHLPLSEIRIFPLEIPTNERNESPQWKTNVRNTIRQQEPELAGLQQSSKNKAEEHEERIYRKEEPTEEEGQTSNEGIS
ncbi:unnamed protein product [Phaedon cochleariae]|uniref:Double jelly roll-like domain-containing protein n=1 Tax=Phaedon cochleariae TaxID=80249 RepID=A0A9N9SJE3_PHACE|nr:unnamed protein product [Phaedon cochleariae]